MKLINLMNNRMLTSLIIIIINNNSFQTNKIQSLIQIPKLPLMLQLQQTQLRRKLLQL